MITIQDAEYLKRKAEQEIFKILDELKKKTGCSFQIDIHEVAMIDSMRTFVDIKLIIQ